MIYYDSLYTYLLALTQHKARLADALFATLKDTFQGLSQDTNVYLNPASSFELDVSLRHTVITTLTHTLSGQFLYMPDTDTLYLRNPVLNEIHHA